MMNSKNYGTAVKKIMAGISLSAAIILSGQSEEPGLLLHSSFDKFTTVPDYAANPETVTKGIPHELQMRMYKDPQDKLNAVLLNNREYIQYTHTGNMNPQCGTVSLWVKPVNWKMSDNHSYQTFFEIRSGDAFRLILGKGIDGDFLNAILIINKKSHVTSIPSKWQTGEWHKIDFVWNSSSMKLYVDGRPPLPGSRGEMIFRESPGFPANIRWATMRLNFFQGWRTNPAWKTAYDDLKIYTRILSPAEILAAYEKKIPSKQTISKLLLTSPGTVPVAAPLPNKRIPGESGSTVQVTHDKEKLYLDYRVGNPGNKYDITARDGELWQNDAVEFHIRGNDGKQRQFIVNPSGALYDSMEGDPKWNSKAVAKAERLGKTWRARLEIPLSDLGGGSSFSVNFGITDRSAPGKSYTWNELYGNTGFSDPRFFGTLHLGDSAVRVDLHSIGDLRAGKLDVSAQAAPGIRLETEYRMMSGISGKGGRATLPEGKGDIFFRAFDANGRMVAFYHRTGIVNPPLTLTAAGLSQKNQIECRLDFSASGMKKGNGSLQLQSEKGDKVYAVKKFFADRPEYIVTFPRPENLPDNTCCKITASIGSFSAECLFRIPDMTPFKTPVARNHVVPSPWIPVSVSGKEIRVLDRVYTFDKAPLPSQIVSCGNPLFTSAPQFLLNGQPIQWNAVQTGENHGDYVEISASGKFTGGAARINGKLWFDGMSLLSGKSFRTCLLKSGLVLY